MPRSDILKKSGGLLLGLSLLIFRVCQQEAHSQQAASREIKVPYALAWGDSVEKIREMLRAVKATESGMSEKTPGRVVIEAAGLSVGDKLLKKSLFTFREGSLVEVELQYNDPTWDGAQAVDFFDRTRRRVDERYGPGTLQTNKVKEHPADEKIPEEMNYTLIIYRWNQPAVVLELTYYCVEKSQQAYRLVSLNYKAP